MTLSGIDADTDNGIDSLLSAYADEPLIRNYDGASEVLFSREAETVENAVMSAIADVERISGVRVVRLHDESLQGLGEIAERNRRTPEGIRRAINQPCDVAFPHHLNDLDDTLHARPSCGALNRGQHRRIPGLLSS